MSVIKLLDQSTINQIAAGEVIERPSAVVKELVENAIDAGATAVTVEIKEGGIGFIRITDNGLGIAKEDISIAFKRHSTSKIKSAEDLLHVSSLGFRGEALSSICAVSQVELVTKTRSSFMGTRYVIEGGEEKNIEDIGCPDGTTFVVRNLFYNTPARRKFLKTAATEAGYIGDLMERLSVSHPEISFKFMNNNQLKLHTSGNGKLKDVIYHIYGRDITAQTLEVNHTSEAAGITGYICKPVVARGNRNHMNYFINGRYIKSKIIHKAIEDAYKPYMMAHRYPFTVLHFAIDSKYIDVNVHPTKMEIRFTNQEAIYQNVYKAVSDTLKYKELIPEVTIGDTKEKKSKVAAKSLEQAPEPFETKRLAEVKMTELEKGRQIENLEKKQHLDTNYLEGNYLKENRLEGNRNEEKNQKSDTVNVLLKDKSASYIVSDSDKRQNAMSDSEKKQGQNVLTDLENKQGQNVLAASENKQSQNALPASENKQSQNALSDSETKQGQNALSDSETKQSQNIISVSEMNSKQNALPVSEMRKKQNTLQMPSSLHKPAGTNTGKEKVEALKKWSELEESVFLSQEENSAQNEQMNLFQDKLLSEEGKKKHKIIGQIFRTYWIVEYEEKMFLIDQHAAHEKVLYEKLMQSLKEKSFLSQMLEPPLILSLSMREEEALKKNMDVLAQLGFEIESFGGKEYSVRGVPADLLGIAQKDLLIELIDTLVEESPAKTSELILEKAASMSCKAAVKGNQNLSFQEAEALIDYLMTLENPYHCPHGRPVIVSMSKYEVEKKFKRVI